MEKQAVWTGSPVEGAPYTPGVIVGNMVYVSGQVPMDPTTRKIVEGEFEDRVRQCLSNVEAVLQAAGTSLQNAVKVVVFLTDMDKFSRMNAVYAERFTGVRPARSCVQVARLPLDVDVEIEAIALMPG